MLRFNFLTAALVLAVLAACTPSGPERVTPVDSLGRTPSALVADASTDVLWSGAIEGCLNCRTSPGYQCVTNTSGNDNTYAALTQTFQDPFPGAVVVAVKAKVYGRLSNTEDGDGTETIRVTLNGRNGQPGQVLSPTHSSSESNWCNVGKTCETAWETRYPDPIPATPPATPIPGYVSGGVNTLVVEVSGSNNGNKTSEYCLSHVELTFTYLPRTLAILIPDGGSLDFGNQQEGTTSAPQPVKVQNTGEATVKSITPSIQDAVGGTFTVVLTPSRNCAIRPDSGPNKGLGGDVHARCRWRHGWWRGLGHSLLHQR